MIDLHLHLDGSLSSKDFDYLAHKEKIKYEENELHVSADSQSLTDYLKCFALPLKLLQSKENISYCFHSLTARLAEKGYIYAEIRFAPLLHLSKGLTQKEVVEAALDGLNKGRKEFPDFDANLILCCMRDADEKINLETVETANAFKKEKVVAVDLAGDETLHDASYYQKIFDRAYQYGLNITIHAGEATGNDEILMAVNLLHAQRIGHGVHLDTHLSQDNLKNITFEFCPTSNLQTKSLPDYGTLPLIAFKNEGIPVTVNSDNMTVSQTDVYLEYHHLVQAFHLSKEDVLNYLTNSVKAAFVSDEQKKLIYQLILDHLDDFYKKIK